MEKKIEIIFPKLGHFWLDSGLVGLWYILCNLKLKNSDIYVRVEDEGLSIGGGKGAVQEILEQAYDKLVKDYYNLSTKKQKDSLESYNFYYNSKIEEFKSFPKRKSVGIAGIIYNKAPNPEGTIIKWDSDYKKDIELNGKKIKRRRGILPASYSYLQKKMDNFLDKLGLDVTTSGLLVDGPNEVRPKMKINVENLFKKSKGTCYLCGESSSSLEDANQTIFPLITGASGVLSFNSRAGSPEKVCWKCSLLGKFVPVNGFYISQGDHMFTFLPYSNSLKKSTEEVFDLLEASKELDENLYYNFKIKTVGNYFQHIYETTFAFLWYLYEKLTSFKEANKDEEGGIDFDAIFGGTISKVPLEFYVIHTKKEKTTFSVKTVWPFRDTRYFYQLVYRLKEEKIELKDAMNLLIDYSEKNEAMTLLRNRICERMLKKQKIVDLIEKHVFKAELNYIKPLLDFVIKYETLVRGDASMTNEERDMAVSLGRNIGISVAKSENGKKGDLFALRKTRKMVDFLEQLNRLQFKLHIKVEDNKKIPNSFIVNAGVYEGMLNEDNFHEFKQFCMIAALNSYLAFGKIGNKGDVK